jgi:hypothetical protein
MTKILSFLIIILFISVQLFAQEETLVGTGEITHGGFGGPVIKYTGIKGESAVLVGGRGGWIINHTFVIGIGGYGLVNQIKGNFLFNNKYPVINLGYGGLELEFIIQSDRLIHYSVGALIGAGGVSYRESLWEDWDKLYAGNDEFFVFEPAINLEVNIISFFRINAGISYRFISGLLYNDLDNKDLAGISGVLTLKFGSF